MNDGEGVEELNSTNQLEYDVLGGDGVRDGEEVEKLYSTYQLEDYVLREEGVRESGGTLFHIPAGVCTMF